MRNGTADGSGELRNGREAIDRMIKQSVDHGGNPESARRQATEAALRFERRRNEGKTRR